MRISLRLRLILLPALVVLAGLVVLAIFETSDARRRVSAETDSSLQMGRLLIENALSSVRGQSSPQAARDSLQAVLPETARHVRISVRAPGAPAGGAQPRSEDAAPAWFVRMLAAPETVETFEIETAAGPAGTVVLEAVPADEVSEVWAGWRAQMAMLGLISVLIIAVVLVAVNMALRPVTQLSDALDRLETGDFTPRVGGAADPLLRRLAQRFNNLAGSLEKISADNERLVSQLAGQRRIREEALHLTISLSARERRLLDLLAQGKTLGEASGDLGVSYRTTAEEAARLRARLGLRTNVELVKYAVETGFGGA